MRGLRRWKNDLTSISTSTSTPPDASSLSSASCTSKAESWQSGRGKGGLSFLRYGQPSRALRCSPYFDMHNTGHPRVRNFRCRASPSRSEEHTSELQSLMRNSYAVFCLKKKNIYIHKND